MQLVNCDRSVGHSPVGSMTGEGEVNARQKSLDVTCTPSVTLPLNHHVRERIDVD
jgi:hypothetical protein